jgi:DNA-binding transcriptional LysR family regulator
MCRVIYRLKRCDVRCNIKLEWEFVHRMKYQQIRYFLAVCDELNFTHAALKCEISQPTLSMGIKRLEQACGGDLFIRTPEVRLTLLAEQLRPILAEVDSLLAKAELFFLGAAKTRAVAKRRRFPGVKPRAS